MSSSNLVKSIPSYIYDSPKHNIYSRHYLRNVLLAMKAEEDIIVFALDINNMGILNTKFSFDTGTNFMNSFLESISHMLPEGTIISRDGGDEFEFHIPISVLKDFFKGNLQNKETQTDIDLDLEEFFHNELSNTNLPFEDLCSKYFQKILNSSSINNGLYTYGLSATVSAIQCKKGNSLSPSYFKAKESITEAKFSALLKSEPCFRIQNLRTLIDKHVSGYINTFRLPKNCTIDSHDKETLLANIQKSLHELFSSTTLPQKEKEESDELNFAFSPEEASILDSFFNDLSESTPSDDILTKLFHLLTIDPITSLPNLTTFDTFVLPSLQSSEKSYNILRLSVTGIKLLNSVYGYCVTDDTLAQVSESFVNLAQTEILDNVTPQTSFPIDISKPFIYYRTGGDFILISPTDIPFNTDNIDNLFRTLSPSLPIVSSCETNCPSENISDALLGLSDACDKKKIPIKLDSMLHGSIGESYLELVLSTCVSSIRSFRQTFPDIDITDDECLKLIYDSFNSQLSKLKVVENDGPEF